LISVSGSTEIKGDIQAPIITPDSEQGNSKRLSGTAFRQPVDAPDFIWPADPSLSSETITLSSKRNEYVALNDPNVANELIVYKKVTVSGGNTTVKVATGTAGNIVTLVVDELDLQNGIITLEGSGRLYIYVKSKIHFGNVDINSYINDSGKAVPGKPSQLVLFLGDDVNTTLNANSIFCGFIYGPKATVVLNGTRDSIGGIVVESASCSGDFKLTYDPDAARELGNFMKILRFAKGPWKKN